MSGTTYTGSKAAVLGYGSSISIGPLASATGTPTYTLIGEASNLKFPSPKRNIIQVTNFQSPSGSIEKRGVAIDFGQVTFDFNYIPNDPGQMALYTAHTTGNGQPFLFTLQLAIDTEDGQTTTGNLITFSAIIAEAGGFDVTLDKQAMGSATLDITGVPVITQGN